MLDMDLACLYEVTVGALNQAVKRNSARFPDDFALPLVPMLRMGTGLRKLRFLLAGVVSRRR